MNVALKNRQIQIPNGFSFQIPEIGFKAPPYQSFDTLVNSVHRVVNANAQLARKYGWPLGREGVATWVDRMNAMMCQQNGWNDYIVQNRDIEPGKFPPPAGAHPLAAVAAGAASLAEWFGAGMKPVEKELSESRAAVCDKCGSNRMGDFGNWFSRTVSEFIRNQIGSFRGLNLTTSRDEKLGVCDLCSCPMKLKVHVGMEHIESNMPEEVWPKLPAHCWMRKETSRVLPPPRD